MIQVTSFSKRYGKTEAVSDLSFSVEPGEILGLVGPNGAGKTTTLRAIAGVLPPTAGKILVAGHDQSGDPIAAKRQLALVPDEPRLFEYLTVREHFRFVVRLYGASSGEARTSELLRELELVDQENDLPAALSRGMKQKVIVGCALVHDPKVILLDEPLTGLDPFAIHKVKALLKRSAEQGTSIVLSSHLLDLVEELTDRVLILYRGRKLLDGRLEELQEQIPELRERTGLEEIFMHVTRGNDLGPSS